MLKCMLKEPIADTLLDADAQAFLHLGQMFTSYISVRDAVITRAITSKLKLYTNKWYIENARALLV